MEFILIKDVKMPTAVGILIFISKINTNFTKSWSINMLFLKKISRCHLQWMNNKGFNLEAAFSKASSIYKMYTNH